MFRTVARYQFRLLVRDRVLGVTLVLFVLAMAYGFVCGEWRIARETTAGVQFVRRGAAVIQRNRNLAAAIEQRIGQGVELEQIPPPFGSRHPRYVSTWCRPPEILPPSPLSSLAIGMSDLYPAGYDGPERDPVSQTASPLQLLVGSWDISFCVVYLLPLFILVLGFDLVASDRDSGILRLALSQPVNLRTILLARAAAVALIVLGAVAIPYGVGTAAGAGGGLGMALRCTLAGAAIVAYAMFWLALCLGLNLLHRTAAENALTLAALWLLFIVLVPFVIDQVATGVHPVPPHEEILNIFRGAPDVVKTVPQSQLNAEFHHRHPELPAPEALSRLGLLYYEGEARREAVQALRDGAQARWEDALARQEVLARRLSYASPATLLAYTLVELAGAGRDRYLDFMRQKREFEARYDAFFLTRVLALPNSVFRAADYAAIPIMVYREESSENVVRRALPTLGMLVVAGMGSLAAALSLVLKLSANRARSERR